MATHTEMLNQSLRRQLYSKQRAMAQNIADVLDAADLKQQRAAQAAVRRNEKSIALLTSKILCTHEVRAQTLTRKGKLLTIVRCDRCRTTVSNI